VSCFFLTKDVEYIVWTLQITRESHTAVELMPTAFGHAQLAPVKQVTASDRSTSNSIAAECEDSNQRILNSPGHAALLPVQLMAGDARHWKVAGRSTSAGQLTPLLA
jgi:uncharacterized membrane protein YdfJ with MMPL/SSD domain